MATQEQITKMREALALRDQAVANRTNQRQARADFKKANRAIRAVIAERDRGSR